VKRLRLTRAPSTATSFWLPADVGEAIIAAAIYYLCLLCLVFTLSIKEQQPFCELWSAGNKLIEKEMSLVSRRGRMKVTI
jgi:hypothetical protein